MEKTIRVERVEDLSERLKQVENEKDRLSKKLDNMKEVGENSALKAEISRLKTFADLSNLAGEGIEIVLDDSKIVSKPRDNSNLYIIHDEDLLRVLNELRAAGAEAISVNDQRILAMSEARCAGPTVLINNMRENCKCKLNTSV
ncbi:MAG: DUF881 domain-containing protein [Phascolarctobacterium sp.]|nr:DUF881 domain-containing protein [Phascolarctobacterium sp.]